MTVVGALGRSLPTRGRAWSRKACASAGEAAKHARARMANVLRMGSGSEKAVIAEKGFSDASREEVVEIEVELHEAADAVAAQAVDGHDHLGAELVILARPDEAGLHGPRGVAALAAVERRGEREFHQRNKMIEGRADADVLHMVLEVFEAVFDGEAVVEIVRVGIAVALDLGREVEAQI